MTAAAIRAASGRERGEASTRTATTSPPCSRRSTSRPRRVVTHSYGGNIALRLATRAPDVFRSLCCHEAPLWSLLEGDPEALEVFQGERPQPRGGRPADRRGRSRGRRAAVRRRGRLRAGRLGERAAARDTGDPSPERPHFLDELQDPNWPRMGGTGFRGSSCPCGSRTDPRARPCSLCRDRSARGSHSARRPRDDRGCGARAPSDRTRALRRGHTACGRGGARQPEPARRRYCGGRPLPAALHFPSYTAQKALMRP